MANALPYRHLYEVLLRFDGADKLRGAHAQYIEGYAVDGQAISATLGPAIPLSLVDEADKAALKVVLGEANMALLTAKESAEADAAVARAEVVEAEQRVKDAEAKVAEMEAVTDPVPA